jgi:sensor domain CHASE-containing protein
MNISPKAALWIAAPFVLFCVGYALTGFFSLDSIADAQERADARGFAWFWLFLAGVGLGFGALSWFIARSSPVSTEEE